MSEQIGNALKFKAAFVASGLPATGLTVTVDVYRNETEIVSAASATEQGDGLYYYTLASGSVDAEGAYEAVFKAVGTADVKTLYSQWQVGKGGVEYLDAAVSSRNATTPPAVSAIRSEMDSNSTKLANLDAAVSTRATPAQVTTIVGALSGGDGSVAHTITVKDGSDNPLDGVSVTVRTGTSTALTPSATGVTDAFGQVTFQLDPGTYHGWFQRSGVNFTNPTEFEVSA